MRTVADRAPELETEMDLVQSRMVTEDVERLAAFYATLLGTSAPLNEYYVELPVGSMSIGFSKARFTEEQQPGNCTSTAGARPGDTILDISVTDVDREFERIKGLHVELVLPPTTQPWGARSMLLRDPEGHLINFFSRKDPRS